MARDLDQLSIEQIRRRYIDKGESISPRVLSRLQRDRRLGVARLYGALKKRFERERDERLRLDAMWHFERLLWKSGVRDIAGIDEAGVGPSAGPVVASGGMFSPDTYICPVGGFQKLGGRARGSPGEGI